MYGRVVQRPKSLDIGKQERVSSLLSKQLKLSAIISEITTCLTTTKDGFMQVKYIEIGYARYPISMYSTKIYPINMYSTYLCIKVEDIEIG